MPRVTKKDLDKTQIVWDYMVLGHEIPKEAGAIIHLGNDTQEATMRRVADIWHQLEDKPLVIVSGKTGRMTKGKTITEAEEAYRFGREYGIPKDYLLEECDATNTEENVEFSMEILEKIGLAPMMIIGVQKPFMERCVLGTFNFQFPNQPVVVTSPQVKFLEYPTASFPMHDVIPLVLGDLTYVMASGGIHQTVMAIPEEVIEAFRYLYHRGYTTRLQPGYEKFL